MVSGRVGIIIIGIGLIGIILLAPRKVLSPEKVSTVVGGFTGGEPTLVSPKPISVKGVMITEPAQTITNVSPTIAQPPAIPITQTTQQELVFIETGGGEGFLTTKNGGGFQADLEASGKTLEEFIRSFQPI